MHVQYASKDVFLEPKNSPPGSIQAFSILLRSRIHRDHLEYRDLGNYCICEDSRAVTLVGSIAAAYRYHVIWNPTV